ncbi:MAG: M15 family metallopeptidase [Gammaproteobacteria bacterium]
MKKKFLNIMCIFTLYFFCLTTNAAEYHANISTIPPWLFKLIQKYTWRDDCPVPVSDLRYVELNYWGLDNRSHQGALVIHYKLAEDVVIIFQDLFNHHFPIEKMQPIELFKGDDEKSMEANNTSAFNCRNKVSGPTFSMHAYGFAIDINPKLNPYIAGKIVLPTNAYTYLNRQLNLPGMITRSTTIYNEFINRGWAWGGDWKSQKDYQHFEKKA